MQNVGLAKFEAFPTFQEWEFLVEIKTPMKVQLIKVDNGGDFTSPLPHMSFVFNSPKQNEMVEKENKTVKEMAQMM